MRHATRAWNRGVLAVGYTGIAISALGAVNQFRPGWLCRWFGHEPDAWTWRTETHEEASCLHCGIPITRPIEGVTA